MGGWVAAHTVAHDHALVGVILISMADMSLIAGQSHDDDLASVARKFVMVNAAPTLSQMPLLALTSNDHLAPHSDSLVAAIKAKGGTNVAAMHMDTDESVIINWLAALH